MGCKIKDKKCDTMENRKTFQLIYASLFAALIFIGTQFIKVPLMFGYFNMGDCFVLLAGWTLGGPYGMAASAIGAALADILSGYVIYAPATVLIKATMAAMAHLLYQKALGLHRFPRLGALIGSAVIAELLMVAGYYAYETILYGAAGAALSIPGNLLQGVAAVVTSVLIIKILNK